MTRKITLTNQYLAKPFAHSYVDALLTFFHYSGVGSCINVGIKYLESSPEELKAIEDNMHNYRHSHQARVTSDDLDIGCLPIFYWGIQDFYGLTENRLAGITKRISAIWWKHPIRPNIQERRFLPDEYETRPSISELIEKDILAYLRSPMTAMPTTPLVNGLQWSLALLSSKLHINFTLSPTDSLLAIHWEGCIFCSNDPYCRLFHGIMEGLVTTINDFYSTDRNYIPYQLLLEQSEAHKIYLDKLSESTIV